MNNSYAHGNKNYTILYLKEKLIKYNLSTKGKKAELQERLEEYYSTLRKDWNTDIVYVSDKIEYSKKDEIFLGTRYNKIKGNGLLRFEKNGSNYDMYLDKNLLKTYIIEHKNVPIQVIEAIINIYTSKIKKTKKPTEFPGINEPIKFDKKYKQHSWIQTKLYQHQLESIYWMSKLENKIKTDTLNYGYKTNHGRFRIFSDFDSSLLFDIQEKKIIIGSKETSHYLMKTKGGILSDDVGLGKTLTILGLFIEYNEKHKIYNKINPIQYNFYPNSNCNLVICPGYLIDQWSNEIFKHVHPPLKHFVISGKKQHEDLTYKDILTSDVVIVSDKFLRSNYYNSINGSFSELQLSKEDPLSITKPIFKYIEWNRVVLDEGHLILSNPLNECVLKKIHSKYRWFISATPVTQNKISTISNFLEWNVEEENYQPFIKPFYIARTKDQLKKDVLIPDYEETIDYIDMTCFEKQVYENCSKTYNKTLLRQLCCSILICNEFKEQEQKTLKEFQVYLMDENKNKSEEIEKNIVNKEQNVKYYENLIEREKEEMPEEMKTQTKKNILIIEKEIKEFELKKANITHFIKYQKNILDNMEKEEHTCLICYEKIDKKDIIITSCCHVYCNKCIQKIEKCSICRKGFTITYLNVNEDLTTKLIHHYGSKIARLISYLQELKKDKKSTFKAIIYTQWSRMLSIVSDCLEKSQLSHVMCNNNMKQIKSILEKFQNKTNIMLLSLQTHHSGLDLHNATHIFFMDVLSGSKEEIEKREKQAIGRVYRIGQTQKVKIVRLIMKNTIEYDLHLENA